MFLPFLTALSAEFGRVKEKAGKHPKAIKRGEFQDEKSTKSRRKRLLNSKQDKGVCRREPANSENTAAATPCGISKGMSKREICEIYGIQRYAAGVKLSRSKEKFEQI